MINTKDINAARKLIKTESKPVIVLSQDNEFNRKIVEQGGFDILLSPERGDRKDGLRQLDSGLNEVLARIAKKKGISLGIDLAELVSLDKKERSVRLSRIKQNIQLCKKTGMSLKLVNYRDKRSAMAFLVTLGASTSQAKEAITF